MSSSIPHSGPGERAKKPSGSLDVDGVRSIWMPSEKRDRWRHRITEQEVQSVDCFSGGSGALPADDMDLGESLSVLALIAATLKSAKSFCRQLGGRRLSHAAEV
ncbi:hypothetical protein JCM24511_06007 [Saitozyma sp. JCM 24511]|nr:hypothetical protein JCM24511_06007 [Saitozyma sp. JCM 24511]